MTEYFILPLAAVHAAWAAHCFVTHRPRWGAVWVVLAAFQTLYAALVAAGAHP